MKIVISGTEQPEGYEVKVEMKGECNLKYVPQIVSMFLSGIACHGEDVEHAVMLGMKKYIDHEENKHE